MDETVKELDLKEFLKPSCPVKIRDRFYKNYHVPSNLIFWEVQKIEEKEDQDGIFYAITAKADNIAVGTNVRVFSSRVLTGDEYTIMKRGVNFK